MEGKRTLSKALGKLGTESAYVVSAEASLLAAEGKTIYPLHIGDMFFPTPSFLKAEMNEAIERGRTTYCSFKGIEPLRGGIAS